MMNAMQEAFGVTTDRYWVLLASFDRECTAKGTGHTNVEHYKRHFFDWTRRHVEINGKDGSKDKGGKATGNTRRHSDRDDEIRDNVNNVLAKYGLTADDAGF